MVCLGLEPGRQDGRRRRIHWAMMARLYFSKFIDWHVRYLHKSADGKGESENDCSDFVIGACLEEITKRASINSSWLKRHYIFLLFLLCSFIFCYLHSYFGQMYCPSLRIEPWRSCLKSKSALLISNPLGGLFERPPPPHLAQVVPEARQVGEPCCRQLQRAHNPYHSCPSSSDVSPGRPDSNLRPIEHESPHKTTKQGLPQLQLMFCHIYWSWFSYQMCCQFIWA